ncbi:MAG: beta-ketoacyl-[acyl-carrier-protein] synthase family protein [Chitinispirillaceae bacterium]
MKTSARDVVVTGIGMITPLGDNTNTTWRNLLDLASCVKPIREQWRCYSDYSSKIWAPLPEIDFAAYGIGRKEKLQLDTVQLLGLAAAQQALDNAGIICTAGERGKISVPALNSIRTGVFMGTGSGGISSLISAQANHTFSPVKKSLEAMTVPVQNEPDRIKKIGQLMHAPSRYNPFVVSMMMPNAVSSSIGIRYGLTGHNETCCIACASGTAAVGHAYRAIKKGELDCALSGGAEFLGDQYGGVFRSFDAAGTLVRGESPDRHCPFDQDRSGFLFSEGGAAVLILESSEHARRRKASVLAKIVGFGEKFDPYSSMDMEPSGSCIEEMVRETVDQAKISPSQVDYINSHGTGTVVNDEVESSVIERVFGTRTPVNSTKSLLGHTLGACGAIEAAVAALSIRERSVHGMPFLRLPVRNLNFIKKSGKLSVKHALSQSFAFGGHNAALLLERYE